MLILGLRDTDKICFSHPGPDSSSSSIAISTTCSELKSIPKEVKLPRNSFMRVGDAGEKGGALVKVEYSSGR